MLTETDSSITFDPRTDTYRLHVDRRGDETVTAAVVRGVAAVTDEPPDDVEPLFETIDPDALNCLYDSTDGDSGRADGASGRANGASGRAEGRVSFRFNGCAVCVYASGTVEITPVEEGNFTPVEEGRLSPTEDDDPMTAEVPPSLRDR